MLSWFKSRHRRRLVVRDFSEEWLRYLLRNVRHYQVLTDDEQRRLRDDLRIFIDDKYWEGGGGLELTDEMKVTIAAQACLLTLNIDHDYYKRVRTILVYPNAFMVPERRQGRGGIISEGGVNSGEAWFRGPVILSWADALSGGRASSGGRNLVIHEFAHALDMMDGLVNGTPPLKDRRQYLQWHDVMTREYQQLIAHARRGEPTLLDQYGATNVGEFFAVATECFFQRPVELQAFHPRLYEVLKGYYKQDFAQRVGRL